MRIFAIRARINARLFVQSGQPATAARPGGTRAVYRCAAKLDEMHQYKVLICLTNYGAKYE